MSDVRAWTLGLGFALASVAGCFDGDFLILEQCSKNGDCGRGQECREGLCIECSGSVCSDYVCPVEEIEGECPCPGRAKFECAQLSPPATDKLDILFVVDNSGWSQQQRLAGATSELVDTLLKNRVDLRIAITTTDMGNPASPAPITPAAAGAFQLQSCLERPDEAFEVDGVDVRGSCSSACTHETIETTETTVLELDEALSRPWLEARGGESNLADGEGGEQIPVLEALACALPLGVGGSGFESPLEAMHQALDRTGTEGDPNFGFLRGDAHLLVVLFTDQADCSHNGDFDDIFTDSNQTFWGADEPNPSICWNAGVECIGDPPQFFDCVAVDKSSDGSVTLDSDQSVLYPVSRYVDMLESIETNKNEGRDGGDELEVLVRVIAGIPTVEETDAKLYELGADPDEASFESEHGIAPGCDAAEGEAAVSPAFSAVPPVRLLEFAERMAESVDGDPVYSVCASDSTPDAEDTNPDDEAFDGAFADVTTLIEGRIPALCMPVCVAEPANCELAYWDDMQMALVEILDCAEADDGGACFHALSGDEVAEGCTDVGGNVQFYFENAPGGIDDLYASCEPATSMTGCPD